jgi:hypothetical protein
LTHTVRDASTEAYLRLVDANGFNSKTGLTSSASARLMRQILVDHARARGVRKRGGGAHVTPLDEAIVSNPPFDDDLIRRKSRGIWLKMP